MNQQRDGEQQQDSDIDVQRVCEVHRWDYGSDPSSDAGRRPLRHQTATATTTASAEIGTRPGGGNPGHHQASSTTILCSTSGTSRMTPRPSPTPAPASSDARSGSDFTDSSACYGLSLSAGSDCGSDSSSDAARSTPRRCASPGAGFDASSWYVCLDACHSTANSYDHASCHLRCWFRRPGILFECRLWQS